MPNIGDKRSEPCPLCGASMKLTRIPEHSANFVRDDAPIPVPIPAHDAWLCDACGHEIEA